MKIRVGLPCQWTISIPAILNRSYHTRSSIIRLIIHQSADLFVDSISIAAPFTEVKVAPSQTRTTSTIRTNVRCQAEQEQPAIAFNRRSLLGTGAALAAATSLEPVRPANANRLLSGDWELVDLPLEPGIVLLDVGFTGSDPNHGNIHFISLFLQKSPTIPEKPIIFPINQ